MDGQAISLIPDNAPKLIEAVDRMLVRQPRPPRTLQSPGARLADLAARGRVIVNQLVALYDSVYSAGEREAILEVATELRLILLQPGIVSPDRRRGA